MYLTSHGTILFKFLNNMLSLLGFNNMTIIFGSVKGNNIQPDAQATFFHPRLPYNPDTWCFPHFNLLGYNLPVTTKDIYVGGGKRTFCS